MFRQPRFAKKINFNFFWYFFTLVLFICAEKMKSGQRGQQPPREQREFPWNNFPEVVSQRVLAEWWKNLEKMKKKEFYIANEVN